MTSNTTKTWHRIQRVVSETEESQHEENDPEGHKRMRSWADEERRGPRHLEESAKWPRWRGWNPNKGPYHKEEEDYHKEEEKMEAKKNEEEEEEKNKPTTGGSSSSGTTGTTTSSDTYWDWGGVWHQWGGDWWQQDDNGWWQKWQLPLQQ